MHMLSSLVCSFLEAGSSSNIETRCIYRLLEREGGKTTACWEAFRGIRGVWIDNALDFIGLNCERLDCFIIACDEGLCPFLLPSAPFSGGRGDDGE